MNRHSISTIIYQWYVRHGSNPGPTSWVPATTATLQLPLSSPSASKPSPSTRQNHTSDSWGTAPGSLVRWRDEAVGRTQSGSNSWPMMWLKSCGILWNWVERNAFFTRKPTRNADVFSHESVSQPSVTGTTKQDCRWFYGHVFFQLLHAAPILVENEPHICGTVSQFVGRDFRIWILSSSWTIDGLSITFSTYGGFSSQFGVPPVFIQVINLL